MKKLIIFFYLLIGVTSFAKSETGDIIIKIHNIKNKKGKILVSLCKTKDEFKGKKRTEFSLESGIQGNSTKLVFKDIKFGQYAVIVLHDENENNKMDFKLVLPKEGYGSSNNRIRMGPPNFDKSLFIHNQKLLELDINLVYITKR